MHLFFLFLMMASFNLYATPVPDLRVQEGEGVITIVGTNDIHGSFANYAWFAGYMNAIRAYSQKNFGKNGAVLLLDAGDAAQGTLLSNYSEGQFAVQLMNAVQYTAAICGNHAFDFGPVNWTVDDCAFEKTKCDPREALKAFAKAAEFPVLGANVVQKSSDKQPSFLKPYTLVPFKGRNIAVFGLENAKTTSTTVYENVKDLDFEIDAKKLKESVEDLKENHKADVFVLVMHEGDNPGKSDEMSKFLKRLPRRESGEPLFDAVIAGHTHMVNDDKAGGMPFIQSGANGEKFGVIQLVVHPNNDGQLTVVADKTYKQAAITIATKAIEFWDQPVKKDLAVQRLITAEQKRVDKIGKEKLATLKGSFDRKEGRISDSVMGNFYADLMRSAAETEIAMINSGDIRGDLPRGILLYEDFFDAIPKNIRLVKLDEVPMEALINNLTPAIHSCSIRGAMQISGLKMYFKRICEPKKYEDPNASLVKLVLDSGEVIYSATEKTERTHVQIATTDFVKNGGAGYRAFRDLPIAEPVADLRPLIVEQLKKGKMFDATDFARGRYINCLEANSAKLKECQ